MDLYTVVAAHDEILTLQITVVTPSPTLTLMNSALHIKSTRTVCISVRFSECTVIVRGYRTKWEEYIHLQVI
jgi:hypothetical protein